MLDLLHIACGGRPPEAGCVTARELSPGWRTVQHGSRQNLQGQLGSSQEKAKPPVDSPETTRTAVLLAHQFSTSCNTLKTHHITRLCRLHLPKCASGCYCLKDYLFNVFLWNLILTIYIKFCLINQFLAGIRIILQYCIIVLYYPVNVSLFVRQQYATRQPRFRCITISTVTQLSTLFYYLQQPYQKLWAR